jgi:short subunit fatty acids transporter
VSLVYVAALQTAFRVWSLAMSVLHLLQRARRVDGLALDRSSNVAALHTAFSVWMSAMSVSHLLQRARRVGALALDRSSNVG